MSILKFNGFYYTIQKYYQLYLIVLSRYFKLRFTVRMNNNNNMCALSVTEERGAEVVTFKSHYNYLPFIRHED